MNDTNRWFKFTYLLGVYVEFYKIISRTGYTFTTQYHQNLKQIPKNVDRIIEDFK